MSIKRLHWLLIVVAAELLIILSLAAWVIIKNTTPSSRQKEDSSSAADKDISLAPVLLATGLEAPTNIVATPVQNDGRLFITEQDGKIQVVERNRLRALPFLDITSKIKSGGEMGLLGLAFHPKFAENGYFFVDYTDQRGNTVVARYQLNAEGNGDPNSEKIILKQKQPYKNHNGGALAFGPDGFLYIAFGDGGSAGDPENRAQDKTTWLGKILRIDASQGDPYAIPRSNPFASDASAKPEIWALGLRNPWRIGFDRKTGDLWIADVGQGNFEEIDFQPANNKGGTNYGWRCYEASQPFLTQGCKPADAYVKPVLEYDHSHKRCSVTGGYVYRGSQYPRLAGKYLYGDFCSGDLYAAVKQTDGTWTAAANFRTPYAISTFGEDSQGELYFADLASGSIYRLGSN